MPASNAFTLYSLAAKMGVSWKKLLWRTDQCAVNQFLHCHLFAEGAKVLTRRANERLAAIIKQAVDQLAKCQPDSK